MPFARSGTFVRSFKAGSSVSETIRIDFVLPI